MKKCKICEIEKELSKFHKAKTNKFGVHAICKICRKSVARKEYEEDPFKTLLRLKKSECKRRNIPFDLDYAYLKSLWTGVCPISGEEITIGNSGMGSHKSAHLDRVLPDRGYVKGNVAYISGRCNRIKYNASIEELEKIVEWMKKVQEGATTIP